MKPNRKSQGLIDRVLTHPPTQFLAIASLVVFIMGCQLSGNSSLRADSQDGLGQYLPVSATAQINDVKIGLEVAETPEQQAMGLMHRSELGEKSGMLFSFSPPRPVGFWMKNTLISLDIIYLRNQTVVTLHPNVPPCEVQRCPTYRSTGNVDQVIELAAGRAEALGIKTGDRIEVTFLSSQEPQNH